MTVLAGIDFEGSFQRTFDDLGEFLPNLIGALLIFLIGRWIAKFIYKLVKKALTKANIDALVDKSGLGAPLERAGYPDSGHFLAKLIYWLLMFIVIKMSVEALGLEAVQELIDDLVNWLPKLFVAILIIFVTGAIANFVKDIVGSATATESWGNAATNVASIAVWFIGGMAALDQVEIASDIVDTLFTVVLSSLAAILVIKFGIGGIWAARDRFWPNGYDRFGAATEDISAPDSSAT